MDDLYLTPCYSIENLYLSDSAFERVVAAEFGLSDTTEEHKCYEALIDVYKRTKASYLQEIKCFNFLIRELRDMENKGTLKSKLNINNLSIDDLVAINIGNVLKKYDEDVPVTIFSELPQDLSVCLQSSEQHFADLSAELWFRGKQHLEFLRVFLGRVKEDRCKKASRKIFKAKGNVKLSLTKANAISELSQYADTPLCLKTFLERQHLPQFVA